MFISYSLELGYISPSLRHFFNTQSSNLGAPLYGVLALIFCCSLVVVQFSLYVQRCKISLDPACKPTTMERKREISTREPLQTAASSLVWKGLKQSRNRLLILLSEIQFPETEQAVSEEESWAKEKSPRLTTAKRSPGRCRARSGQAWASLCIQ